jgi:hypothetical protein
MVFLPFTEYSPTIDPFSLPCATNTMESQVSGMNICSEKIGSVGLQAVRTVKTS